MSSIVPVEQEGPDQGDHAPASPCAETPHTSKDQEGYCLVSSAGEDLVSCRGPLVWSSASRITEITRTYHATLNHFAWKAALSPS